MGLSAASVADLTIENYRETLHDFSKYLVKPKRRLHKLLLDLLVTPQYSDTLENKIFQFSNY